MRININGEWLDMSDGDIAVSWANMRFSDVFADDFTTDFELPMTERNMRLLDVWSVLSRRGEPFGDMIRCGVMMQGRTSDGLLAVNGVTSDSISVTVFIAALPEVLTAVTRIEDEADTIVDFTLRPWEVSSDSSIVNYTYYSAAGNVLRPNVKLRYIMQRLTALTGVTMPSVSEALRVVGTRQVVCPQVTRQALLMSVNGSGSEWIRYGQHITNEVDEENVTVQMQKSATVTITAYARTVINDSPVIRLQRRPIGGTSWTSIGTINSGAVGTTVVTTLTFGISAGAEWRIMCGGWQGQIFLACTYSNYEITEDDYAMPLNFDPSANYALPSWVDEDISYVYYGVMANIPTFTVRDLLSSVAWMQGKRINFVIGSVELVEPDATREIAAQITSVRFDSSNLARLIKVESAGGNILASATIPNAKLESEKTLHKSIFARLQGIGAWNIVRLVLYSENDGTWTAQDFGDGIALAERAEHSNGTIYLQPIASWSLMGIDQLTRVCEIEAVTDAQISDCDYVFIEGHKFMLIEGDQEEASGLTTFKALQI